MLSYNFKAVQDESPLVEIRGASDEAWVCSEVYCHLRSDFQGQEMLVADSAVICLRLGIAVFAKAWCEYL